MHRQTDRIDEYIDLRDSLATLPTRQRRVAFLISIGMNQAEIAFELGVTQPRVCQMVDELRITLIKVADYGTT